MRTVTRAWQAVVLAMVVAISVFAAGAYVTAAEPPPSPGFTPPPTQESPGPEPTGPLPSGPFGSEPPSSPTPPPDPSQTFVSRQGVQLRLGDEPFYFAGINIYNANSDGWCGHEMRSPGRLAAALDSLPGTNVIRAWFFQPLAQNFEGSARDWSAFDQTLAEAAARGFRVVVTLSDHWGECGSKVGTTVKSPDWYRTGYHSIDPGMMTSYRDYVAEIVDRYKDSPTVLFWQLMNEAETKDLATGDCEPGGHFVLRDFAADVSGLIKSIDPNHLVSLGTLGGPQCGPHRDFYETVHDVPTIDVCEFHDYSPFEAMPTFRYADGYENGLESRIRICQNLGKPLFVGESGLPRSIGLDDRAKRIRAKIQTQFNGGSVGYLAWAYSDADVVLDGTYDIRAGDPALAELRVQFAPSYVSAAERHLDVDGQPWTLHGASTYHTTNRGGPNDPDEIIALAQQAGLNTLRIGEMFHQLADGGPGAPFDAGDWARTDRFLDKLRQADMRAILDLSAFRNFLVHRDLAAGGWVELCRDDAGVTVEQRLTVDFAGTSPYRPAVYPEWDAFIEFVANRVNTANGLRYRDDPTIAIVSFAGEPNPPDSILCGKAASTAELTTFYGHVMPEWKAQDSQHLLSNGGFIHLDWAELHGDADGSGIDWEAIFALPSNDIPSIHTYPARIDSGVPADFQSPKVSAFVASLGKPWFTEEFGWRQGVTDDVRADYYQWIYEQQETYGSAGSAFWNLGVEVADGTFDVSPQTPLTWAVVQTHSPSPASIDADGDGVGNSIDVGNAAFDNRSGTTGRIIDTGGHDVLVVGDPGGVRFSVTGNSPDDAVISICGFTLRLAAPSGGVAFCGSITLTMTTGEAQVVLGGGLATVTVRAGTVALVAQNPDGSYAVENLGGPPVIVVVDGLTTLVVPGAPLDLEAWNFIGFSAPVDSLPVFNVVPAGRAIPLKWRLLDADGVPVTDLSTAVLRTSGSNCQASAPSDVIEQTTADGSGLQNLGNGYYQMNWKTPKQYGGMCKTLSLDIGDGVTHTALFQFKK